MVTLPVDVQLELVETAQVSEVAAIEPGMPFRRIT
jgi:hypothetical protein